MEKQNESEFEKAAKEQRDEAFAAELWQFLKSNKKWWLLPIVLALLLAGVLAFLSGPAAAPFIYALF